MDDHKKRDHVPLKESDTLPGSGLSERSFFGDAQMTRNELRRITLKVQKANDFSGEGSVQNQSPGKKIRVCKVCNKSFSSGRALGGHMRTHAEVQGDDVLIQNQNSKLKVYHPTPKNRLISYANSGKYKASNATGGVPIKANPINNSNPSCSLCGKDFPSMKSLFGHMRCHPEREWRGIQRPPAAKNSSSSTVSDSVGRKVECQIDSGTTTGKSAFNLAQSLPSWSVTAKRGRKSIASLGSKESIPDAVYDLMMLAQGNSLDSVLSNKRRSEQSEAPNRNFPPKQPKIEDGDQDFEYLDPSKKRTSEESQSGNREFPSKKLKRSNPEPVNMDSTWDYTNGFGEDWKQSNEEESDSQTSDYCTQQKQFSCLSEISKKNKKKRKKKIKLRDLETVGDMGLIDYKQMPIAFSDNYRCSTCNKSFSSHQALGGHRTSHKKGKNNLPISDMDEYAFSDASADEEQYGVADNLTQVDGLPELDDAGSRVAGKHRCNICNKTFPTGQALGGHKRCHWTGPVEVPSSSVASPEEVSKIRRGMLDFDLNKLPVMEDEEGFESVCTQSMDIRQPVDYASSSYNSVA